MAEWTDEDERQKNEAIAKAAAAYAHEAYFSSRRGILPSDQQLTVVYDNNPRTESKLRTHQLTVVAKIIETSGGKKLAEASYPVGGEDDGYTLAMVFEGDWRQVIVNSAAVE